LITGGGRLELGAGAPHTNTPVISLYQGRRRRDFNGHHKIYLSDARGAKPTVLGTVLRQPARSL
jgi:hypothetical protein